MTGGRTLLHPLFSSKLLNSYKYSFGDVNVLTTNEDHRVQLVRLLDQGIKGQLQCLDNAFTVKQII